MKQKNQSDKVESREELSDKDQHSKLNFLTKFIKKNYKTFSYIITTCTIISYLLYLVSNYAAIYYLFKEDIYITFIRLGRGNFGFFFPIDMDFTCLTFLIYIITCASTYSFVLYIKDLILYRYMNTIFYHIPNCFYFVMLVFNSVILLIGIFQYTSDDVPGMYKDGRNFDFIALIFAFILNKFGNFGAVTTDDSKKIYLESLGFIQNTVCPLFFYLDLYYLHYVIGEIIESKMEDLDLLNKIVIGLEISLTILTIFFGFYFKQIGIIVYASISYIGFIINHYKILHDNNIDIYFHCFGLILFGISILILYIREWTNKEKKLEGEKVKNE